MIGFERHRSFESLLDDGGDRQSSIRDSPMEIQNKVSNYNHAAREHDVEL